MPETRRRPCRLRRQLARIAAAIACATAVCLTAACGSSADSGTASADGSGALHIGVLQVASAAVLDSTVTAFEGELRHKLAPRKITFTLKNAQGDQSLITSISRDFAHSSDDAFAVIGTPAVIALAQQIRNKPIFAIAMGDPVGAKLAKSLAEPGGNVTGSTDYVDPALLLKSIMQIKPVPKKIGTIYDPSNENMQVWVKALHAAIAKYPGVSVVESTVAGPQDVASAARSLIGRVDAELIGPDTAVFSGLAVVGSTARSSHLPVYLCGGDATTAGILASIGPDYPTVGRLAADSAAKVFAGTPVAKASFGRPSGVTFTVNKATMSTLGITLPASIRASATVQ